MGFVLAREANPSGVLVFEWRAYGERKRTGDERSKEKEVVTKGYGKSGVREAYIRMCHHCPSVLQSLVVR